MVVQIQQQQLIYDRISLAEQPNFSCTYSSLNQVAYAVVMVFVGDGLIPCDYDLLMIASIIP